MLTACPDCKRAFLAKPETGVSFCSKCNRIEVPDGTVFLPEQHHFNKARVILQSGGLNTTLTTY